MLSEKDFEDIICKYPELIEDSLTLKGRQLTLYGRRMDILFEDKFKRKLIIELKVGPIKDEHIGQILSYEGILLSADDPSIRVMLVGNRVPPNIQKSLDHHGIGWREITLSSIREFIKNKNDTTFPNLFENGGISLVKNDFIIGEKVAEQRLESSVFKHTNADELVEKLKSHPDYQGFKKILDMKIKNEAKAKTIIEENLGKLNHAIFKEVFELVDNYPPVFYDGKMCQDNWFGRLLKPNALKIFKESEEKINEWFRLLLEDKISMEQRIDLLRKDSYHISGLNTGFITLMLYLLDKSNYLIWFRAQHDGLRFLHPQLDEFNGKGEQYSLFNDIAKVFAKQYDFDHTEIDWILSYLSRPKKQRELSS
jgi:hypothetical protein